jgi:sporulation protein YlmC with PRC-barrel domain
MGHESTDQPPSPTLALAPDQIDPQAHLHLRMRVLGTHGKSIGKVETFDRDTATGQLSTLVIRHGLFSNKLTSVPVTRVKWVNADSVILDFTPSAFKKLPILLKV